MTRDHPMPGTWHLPDDQLDGYLVDHVDDPTAASIESHLIGCAACRDAIAQRSEPAIAAQSWAMIERAIDSEPASSVERLGRRIGIPDRTVRALAPTLSSQVAWLLASGLALLCAAVIARRSSGLDFALAELAFLTIAPLAPLAAVVAALSTAAEPAPEVVTATPASRLRIGALRAGTAMAAAIAVGLTASLVLPGQWISAIVWLLPAVALCGLGALTASRWAPEVTVGVLGSAWVLTVVVAARLAHDRLAAFRPGAQLTYLAISAIAAALIAVQHNSLDARSIR